jgi:hypothetical protein
LRLWISISLGTFIALHVAWFVLSFEFGYGSPMPDRPIVAFTVVMVALGFVYLALIRRVTRRGLSSKLFAIGLGIGAGVRLLTVFSGIVLEDDVYRYLWDGAVTAHGINPYRYSPETVANAGGAERPDLIRLQPLAEDSGIVFERINHPHLRTIYPPVAQGFFALSHWIAPWSVTGWRFVLLSVDLLTLFLLSQILRRLGVPAAFLLVYWLNPLLIKEMCNSAHMDVLLFPFLLGAFACSLNRKPFGAMILLALGAGVKIWPVLLAPLLLRGATALEPSEMRRLKPAGIPEWMGFWLRPKILAAACLLIGLLVVLFSPVWLTTLDRRSGFVAYARVWEMNDALFMLIVWVFRGLGAWIGVFADASQVWARGVVLAALMVIAFWTAIRPIRDGRALFHRGLVIVAALFFLSPTQFPWYFLWMLPFLAVTPRVSLLLLTPLLALYYLRFHLIAVDRVGVFDYGIVWAEYVPVWAWIAVEWARSRRSGSSASAEPEPADDIPPVRPH